VRAAIHLIRTTATNRRRSSRSLVQLNGVFLVLFGGWFRAVLVGMVVVADRIVVQDCSADCWQPRLAQFAASNGEQLAQFRFAQQVRFGCDLSAVLRAIALLFCSSLTELCCVLADVVVTHRFACIRAGKSRYNTANSWTFCPGSRCIRGS
jgi:hypothetical protein